MTADQKTTEEVPGIPSDGPKAGASDGRSPAPFLFASAMLGIILVAAGFRLLELGNRPMHCDEAVHGIKFGRLLERGEYTYDPHEYHGPSLNYLTLPVARLASAERITQVNETHLRLVPAIFGIVLVGLPWLVRREMGYAGALVAAALSAVSPAMVFYSRYYIQEMLLVCFSFAAIVALWRYAAISCRADRPADTSSGRTRLRQAALIVTLGTCLGLMHASKETFVIVVFAMAVAAAFAAGTGWVGRWKRVLTPFCLVVGVAAGVSALFHSSFLSNPEGVIDSVATYLHYLERASGAGSEGSHEYPWYHYFRLLFWWRSGDGPVWTEAVIGILAAVGGVAAISGKGIPRSRLSPARFLGIYTIVLTLIYSAIAYKTPWCALGFLHGMILLAGVGATVLFRVVPGRPLKAVIAVALAVALGHLGRQAHRASFVDFEDVGNPYVYAHTTSDVPRLVEEIRRFAGDDDGRPSMHVQVICPDRDYWPLPWYMRDFEKVGWFSEKPSGTPGELIVVQPTAEVMSDLNVYLYVDQPPGKRLLYARGFERRSPWLLRPGVALEVFGNRRLLEQYLEGGGRFE